jgi:hypothetical protein
MPVPQSCPKTLILTIALAAGAPDIAVRYADDTQPEREPNAREIMTFGIAASTTSSTTMTLNPMLGVV